MTLTSLQRTALTVGLAGLLGVIVAGCPDQRALVDPWPLRAFAAMPAAGQSAGNGPTHVQRLLVTVEDGRFEANVYSVEASPTRLVVTSSGGPYTFTIDRVLGPRQLPAQGTKEVELALPGPGKYRMTLAGNATDVATLTVRPPGVR